MSSKLDAVLREGIPKKCCDKKGPSVRPLLSLNFSNKHDFNCLSSIGLEDGCVIADHGLLTVNSAPFQRAAIIDVSTPEKECETRREAWLDAFHFVVKPNKCVNIEKCRETILETRMATGVFFNTSNRRTVIPEAFFSRTNNIENDPRLAHGLFGFLAPESGIMAGFMQTNLGIWAFYGRAPYANSQKDCSWLVPCVEKRRCDTCIKDNRVYTPHNYEEDRSYAFFKQTIDYHTFIRFQQYVAWRFHCKSHGYDHYDMKLYAAFCDEFGYINADSVDHHGRKCYGRSDWIKWCSYRSYDDYVYYKDFMVWKDYEHCHGRGPRKGCSGGCAPHFNYHMPGFGKCGVSGCTRCQSCAVAEESENTIELKRETYSYEFGAVRCCCDPISATFMSLKEIGTRGACDPMRDFQCLSIGVDSSHSVLTWYINNTQVHQHVGIGRRPFSRYMVRENGGYAEDVCITRVLPIFGTGTMMDATLPLDEHQENYHYDPRTGTRLNRNPLVQLQQLSDYKNTLPNRFGELQPISQADFFGSAGMVASQYSRGPPHDPAWRVFGQGAMVRFMYVKAFNRRTSQGYVWFPKDCREVYGPLIAESCCKSNLCGPRRKRCGKDHEEGCCGTLCDEPSSDDDCCEDRVFEARVVPVVPLGGGAPILINDRSPMGCEFALSREPAV